MEMVTLTINGQTVQAPKNATILEASRSAGIYIPTLCYHPELAPEGACRLYADKEFLGVGRVERGSVKLAVHLY